MNKRFIPGAACLLFVMMSFGFISIIRTSNAQQTKYETLGYRACGTERGTCHQGDGNWWKADPHFRTINDLKRKRQKSMRIAQAYGMNPNDYLKGTSKCAECHGEVVTQRASKNMNTGVSCESCHGSAGPKTAGYFEVHQEGTVPKDPLSTNRAGYQKALKVGLRELRNLDTRATTCVRCHQINEKKLLEADHPTGEGFDYIAGVKNNISKHWDYKVRLLDLKTAAFDRALQSKPIPVFTVRTFDIPSGGIVSSTITDTVLIYVDPKLPPWLNPKKTISVRPFEPQLSDDAPVDSILLEIKNYIEYIHRQINQK